MEHSAAGGLRVLSLVMGAFLIFMGLGKLGWFTDSSFLVAELRGWWGGAPAVSRWYIDTVAMPGAPLFARLVPLGELAAGAALVAGYQVRLAAAVALLMILNFHFAMGILFPVGLSDQRLRTAGGRRVVGTGDRRTAATVQCLDEIAGDRFTVLVLIELVTGRAQCDNKGVFHENRPIVLVPVIFTTASVWTADTDLATADLISGEVDLGSTTVTQVPWLWLDYPVSPGLQHGVTRSQPDQEPLYQPDLRNILETEYSRAIAVVGSGGVDQFLASQVWTF